MFIWLHEPLVEIRKVGYTRLKIHKLPAFVCHESKIPACTCHEPKYPEIGNMFVLHEFQNGQLSGISVRHEQHVSVALSAEPRGEKKLFFVQILGGEKLLKFGEKWAVKNF